MPKNIRNNLVNLLHSKLGGPVGLKALITENDHAQLKIISKQCNGPNSNYNDLQILYPKTDNIHNDNHPLYKKELEILQRIQKEKLSGPATQPTAPSRPAAAPGIPPAAPSKPAAAPGTAPGPTLKGGVGENGETEEVIKDDVRNTLNTRNNLVNLLHSKLDGPVGLKALITENDHAQLKIVSKQCNGENSIYNDMQILYPKTDNIHNDNHLLYKKELEILQRIQKEKNIK